MGIHPSNHRGNASGHHSYPRTNYYRDYYTGNNYEDEDGILLNNEYDHFGDDFFQQKDNSDEFDMPFRRYGEEMNLSEIFWRNHRLKPLSAASAVIK